MTKEKIDILIDRFMAGETSNAEESVLMEYFRRKDLPENHRQLRYMMMFYDNKLTEPASPAPATRRRGLRLSKWQWLSAAAMIAVLVSVAVSFMLRESQPEEYIVYAGSYIIRDGKKITDIATILPELKKAEQIALEQERKIDREIAASLEYDDPEIYEMIDFDDPVVKEVFLETVGRDNI